MIESPKIIEGGFVVDKRGQLSFINDLGNFIPKRFYIVQNHQQGYIRAFHGHKFEAKVAYVLQGTVLFHLIPIDEFRVADSESKVFTYVLSSDSSALYIPSGYFNGFKTLTPDAKIMFLSSKILNEAKEDDIRVSWDIVSPKIWEIPYY